MTKVTQDTEFLIGIDFGHGETSACYYDMKANNQPQVDLDILKGLNVIPSAVAIVEDEGEECVCIGQKAVNNSSKAKAFRVSFKNQPSQMSTDERNIMIKFMKAVYAQILEREPSFKVRKHVVYIARPSQDIWDSEEDAYIKMAEEAGIPIAGIQKESRAAYFRARTQPLSQIDSQVKDGVLIVDFGSSTIDFTYLNSEMLKPIDDGSPLGASLVEETLLEYAMNNPQDCYISEFAKYYGHDKKSSPFNQLEYEFRKQKEDFYTNEKESYRLTIDYNHLTEGEEYPIDGLGRFALPRKMVNEVLSKYISQVKEKVIAFKENKLKGRKVASVYLTGGASRMDFVHQIFMEVFNLDDRHVPLDPTPSLIVSQGVAHLSYADIKTEKTGEEMKKRAHDIINKFDWFGAMRKIICDCMKNAIINRADSIMYTYSLPNSSITNVKGLKEKIKTTFEGMANFNFVPECEKSIRNEIVSVVKEELKSALYAYNYDEIKVNIDLSALDAHITISGASALSEKFTGDDPGHVIQDAIRESYGFFTMDVNQEKTRSDKVRAEHYDFYKRKYYKIYDEKGWNSFFEEKKAQPQMSGTIEAILKSFWRANKVEIKGIDKVKDQVKSDIDKMIDDYVDHAKLAIFFN